MSVAGSGNGPLVGTPAFSDHTAKMNRYVAEAVGTFFLVFAGTGAIVVDAVTGGAVTHAGIALTFGMIVMVMIYALGEVSGAHFNPAVTLGFVAAGRLPLREAPPYVVSQCAGAIAASASLGMLFPATTTLGATSPSGALPQAFVLEIVITALLMFVILAVSTGAREKGITAGLAIGATVALCAMFAGPVSGASMNPARSLGPALAAGELAGLWIYLSAPVVGAVLAVALCRAIHGPACCGNSESAADTA